ncbi:MAG: carbohydrate kinase family protein [Patescibacteria group bacterium]
MAPTASPSKRTHDVIAVGAGTIDHYVSCSAFEKRKDALAPEGIDTCFPVGAKLKAERIEMQTGGGATNAAVTFARQKLKTAVICRVGKDLYAPILKDILAKEKIETDLIQTDPESATAQSIILLSDIGHRTILIHRGASAKINKREIPWQKLRPRWFYVTSLGGDLSLFSMILDRAEACGASVCWNPGNAELAKGMHVLAPLIRRTDIFDVNREEAAMLTNQPPRHLKRIMHALEALPKLGLLITDGPKGAYLHTKCCSWYAPPLPGKRVNTTGAGDALGSGFLAGFIRTCDLSIALKVGMLNALGVIMHMGAKTGILKEWPKETALKHVRIQPAKLHD